MRRKKKRYALDASALVAWIQAGPAMPTVDRILSEAHAGRAEVIIHLINLGEVFYKTWSLTSQEEALKVVSPFLRAPYQVINLSFPILIAAAKMKIRFHVPYVDSIAAATAGHFESTFVTSDDHFRPLEAAGLIEVLWLR